MEKNGKAKYLRPIDYREMTGLDWAEDEKELLNEFLSNAYNDELVIMNLISKFCDNYNVDKVLINYKPCEVYNNSFEHDLKKIKDKLNFPNPN